MSATYMYGGEPTTSHRKRYSRGLSPGYDPSIAPEYKAGDPRQTPYPQQLQSPLGEPLQHDITMLRRFPTKI